MQKGWKQAELKEEKLALSSQEPISEKNEILSLAASVFSIKIGRCNVLSSVRYFDTFC